MIKYDKIHMENCLEMKKWEKQGKFWEDGNGKNPFLELSLRELKKEIIWKEIGE